jgi:hypothetical protein
VSTRRPHVLSFSSSLLAFAPLASLAAISSITWLPAIAYADPGSVCVKASEKGQEARDRGALRAARAHFIACGSDSCPKSMRADCVHWLEEVDASLPSIVVGAKDASGSDIFDVRVRVDGETVEDVQSGRPLVLDPGPHVVHFERGAAPAVEMQDVKVILRTGEHNRPVTATLGARSRAASDTATAGPPGPEGASHIPTATWVFGGIGVVGLGVFGTFAIVGSNEKSRLRGTCSPGCTDADVSHLRTDYIVADIALGVGLVSLGIATYFLLTNKSDGTSSARTARAAADDQRFARTIWK